MGNETKSEKTAARRWPRVLLAVSLTFNLLVLGVFAGAQLHHVRGMRDFPPGAPEGMRDMMAQNMMAQAGMGPFFAALPPQARQRIGADLRHRVGDVGTDRAALAGELRATLAAIRAEPFDEATLSRVLAAQDARVAARFEAGRAALLAQIAAMSPDERQRFADRIETRFRPALARHPAGPGMPPEPGN